MKELQLQVLRCIIALFEYQTTLNQPFPIKMYNLMGYNLGQYFHVFTTITDEEMQSLINELNRDDLIIHFDGRKTKIGRTFWLDIRYKQ